MFPLTLAFIVFPSADVESIFEARSITLNIVEADPRAVANASKNGAALVMLSAPVSNPKNV